MDAMKIITEGMIKEDRPEFNVGDTVRVSVRTVESHVMALAAEHSRTHGGSAVELAEFTEK